MNEAQRFKRFPAVQCWISHILESKFSKATNSFFSIFGKIKRVRIIATIVDKREIIISQENDSDDFSDSNMRIEFDLDDGTGQLRANIWRADPLQYEYLKKGTIVDLIGLLKEWNEFINISPEIIKKIEEPNIILLRNAEIIKTIKFGDIHKIPESIEEEDELTINEFSSEIDINDLFESGVDMEVDEDKEKIYSLIERYSLEGDGISLKEIKTQIKIPVAELTKYLQDLEMESRIYQSEEGIYQNF